jgi:tRNA modification GTPase
MQQNLPADIASVPLRESLLAIGEITGDNLVESAIHDIFSEFCIGK